MFYRLYDKVFLVEGSKYGCLYDLPHNILYRINSETIRVIKNAINDVIENSDADELKMIDLLIKKELLICSDSVMSASMSIDNFLKDSRTINFAWIEITNQCNLRCIHCYNEHDEIPKKRLSLEQFKYIVDELIALNVRKMQIIGGEPFMIKKENLLAMLDYLSPRVGDFELFTNNTIITSEDLLELKQRYQNICIATSLHSFIKEECDKITNVEGSYNKIVENIRFAKSIDLPIRYVGTKFGNVKMGEELDFGSPSRRDFIRLSGKGSLKLYDDDLLRARMITKDDFAFKDLESRIKKVYMENCFSTHLYIGSDMKVYPCPMERRICHGSLENNHLDKILSQNILNQSKEIVDGCKDCEYRYLCIDCRPDSLTGKYEEKPWYCTYNPYMGEWTSLENKIKEIKQ